MNATTRQEAAGPLGVIGCLTAGFEMVGRHLWLIALPVLLDLFLWLGPRLSVVTLLQQFAAVLKAQSAPDPATMRQVTQAAQLLEQFGSQFNLFSFLSALPLLNVPSLLAWHASGTMSPLGEPQLLMVTNVLILVGWGAMLIPIGMALGVLYLNSLAHRVCAMRSPGEQVPALTKAEGSALSEAEGPEQAIGVSGGVGRLIRVFLFATGMLIGGAVLTLLWMLLVGTVMAIAPMLGLLVWAFGIGLGSYIALHFLFVVHGVLIGGRGLLRAVWESILLIHAQFASVIGLVVLAVVIYEGLGLAWSLPSGDSWSLLVGILGNGCIATGLTAATFVFYQERMVRSG
jgi:hypothetical protein